MPIDVTSPPPFGGHMRDTSLADALSERYLAYAMSTITANAFSISLLSRNADDGFPTPSGSARPCARTCSVRPTRLLV